MPIELVLSQGSILGSLLFLILINDMSLITDFHIILYLLTFQLFMTAT